MLKTDRFLADADWAYVEKSCDISNPYNWQNGQEVSSHKSEMYSHLIKSLSTWKLSFSCFFYQVELQKEFQKVLRFFIESTWLLDKIMVWKKYPFISRFMEMSVNWLNHNFWHKVIIQTTFFKKMKILIVAIMKKYLLVYIYARSYFSALNFPEFAHLFKK